MASSKKDNNEAELSISEQQELKRLCKDLLSGADKCSQEPHFVVQPFFGVIKRHSSLINKLGLMD